MGVIYLRTNLVNGMQYVGQTTNLKRRERQWKCLNWRYGNYLLTEDRNKFGINNFKVEILEECDNNKLDELEKFYIEKLNTSFPNGYNSDSGGKINFKHSKETIRKISDSNKKIAKSPENIEQLKKHSFKKGHKPWNKGIKGCFSEETTKKMSESAIGRKRSDASRKKQSETLQGKWINREDISKKVYQYTLDDILIAIYPSRNEAARQTGFNKTSIGNCCNGLIKTYKGYKWSYKPL